MSPHISPEPYTLHNAILAVNIENMLHIVTRVTVPLILDLSSSITPVLLQMCYLGGDCSVGLGTVSTSGPGTRLKCAACKVACL